MALVGLQYEPASLYVKHSVLKKNRTSLIPVKNQHKVKALLNGVDVGNEAHAHKC